MKRFRYWGSARARKKNDDRKAKAIFYGFFLFVCARDFVMFFFLISLLLATFIFLFHFIDVRRRYITIYILIYIDASTHIHIQRIRKIPHCFRLGQTICVFIILFFQVCEINRKRRRRTKQVVLRIHVCIRVIHKRFSI